MLRKYLPSVCMFVCLLLCVLLIGRVVLHSDIPLHMPRTTVQRVSGRDAEQDTRQITLDGGALTTLISRQLPVDFPLTNLNIQLTEQGSACFTADIDPCALELPRAASILLPNTCKLTAVVSIGYQEGSIILHPQTLEIGGLTLPHSLLDPACDTLAEAATNGLRAQGISLQSLSIENEILYINLD